MIDIKGTNKADVLAKLYNASRQQGIGFTKDMTVEQAQALLDDGQTYFDYLWGRALNIDLRGDELNPKRYDRENGPGAAASALGR